MVFLALVGAEEILRHVWHPPKGMYDYSHPFIRRRIRPNVELVYHGDPVTGFGGEFVFKGGPVGYRTKTVITREKPEGAYRIFFVGGSTTACSYLPQEVTFPQRVEDLLLSSGLPYKFQCANAGVDGSTARDCLTLIDYDIALSHPDCILIMHGVNDMAIGLTPDFAPDGSDVRTAKAKAKSNYEEYFGDPHLYLYQFYKSLGPRHSKRFTLDHIRGERKRLSSVKQQEISEFPNVSSFVLYMRLIASSCKALGIRPIFVTQCSLYAEKLAPEVEARLGIPFPEDDKLNPTPGSMMRGMEAYNNAVRQTAQDLEVELIDLDKEIPKTLENMYDHVHFSVKGSEKVGDVIAHYLIDRFKKS
jgi:lysophospholipase L1-like esterase